MYILCCFKSQNKTQALKDLDTLANSRYDIPGDQGFPLNSIYANPVNQKEAGKRTFFKQFRIKSSHI